MYKAQIDHLKAGQFEESSVAGQEICVLPLLLKFFQKQRANSAQPVGNYSARSSCAFSPARITAYEAANKSFIPDMQL